MRSGLASASGERAGGGDSLQGDARARLEADFLPLPLTADEIDRIAASRWRDRSSRDAIVAARDRYLEAMREPERRVRRPLRAQLEAAYAWNPAQRRFDPQPGPELVAFHRDRVAWLAALDAAELELVRFLVAIPPSEGGASLGRVRLRFAGERDRRPISDPLAGLPLDDVLSRMPEPEIAALLEGLEMESWRERIVAAHRQRRQALDQLLVRRAEALIDRGPFDLPSEDPRRTAFDRATAELDALESSAESPIAELNRGTIARLRAQLPPTVADALAERVARLVHPQVFDEERGVPALLRQLAAEPGLDAGAADSLRALAVHLEQRLAASRAQLLRLLEAREAAERVALAEGSPRARRQLLVADSELLAAHMARRRAARQAAASARGLIPPQSEASLVLLQHHLDAQAAVERADLWLFDLARRELTLLDHPGTTAPERSRDTGSDSDEP